MWEPASGVWELKRDMWDDGIPAPTEFNPGTYTTQNHIHNNCLH